MAATDDSNDAQRSNPTVAIVGPGAIGTTIAAALSEAGVTPALYGRSDRERLELRVGEHKIVVPGPVITDVTTIERPVDLVFLAVKATQIEAAAPWLVALGRPGTVVCVLQNGVEQEASVSPLVPGAVVVPSVVWFPAETQPDGSVVLRGEPRLTVPDLPAGRLVRDALRDSRISVELGEDFVSIAWRKLLQNAAAGLMVLTGRRAGMFDRTDIGQLALAYLRECLTVARAEGAMLSDDVPQEIVDVFRAYPPDMGTSILADRAAGSSLEWDIRNGVILRRGRARGIPVPISELVVPLLAAASDGPG